MSETIVDEMARLFRDYSCRRLGEMTDQLGACIGRLTVEQIWRRGGEHENAVGNLVLHLCGNMRQWIVHGVGGEPDVRLRELEFSTRDAIIGAELMAQFQETVAETVRVIGAVDAQRLTERTTPQGRDVSVLDAIYQVVGHVQLHVGQVILLTKQMVGQDLDLTMPRPR